MTVHSMNSPGPIDKNAKSVVLLGGCGRVPDVGQRTGPVVVDLSHTQAGVYAAAIASLVVGAETNDSVCVPAATGK